MANTINFNSLSDLPTFQLSSYSEEIKIERLNQYFNKYRSSNLKNSNRFNFSRVYQNLHAKIRIHTSIAINESLRSPPSFDSQLLKKFQFEPTQKDAPPHRVDVFSSATIPPSHHLSSSSPQASLGLPLHSVSVSLLPFTYEGGGRSGGGEERDLQSGDQVQGGPSFLPSFLPSFQGQAVYTRQVYCTAEEEEEEEEEKRRKERLLGRIKGYGQILFAPWGSATKMFGSGFEGPRLEGNSASKQRERERERLRATIAFAGLVSGLEPRLMVSGIWAGP